MTITDPEYDYRALDVFIDDLIAKHGIHPDIYRSELICVCTPVHNQPGYRNEMDFEFAHAERMALAETLKQVQHPKKNEIMEEFDIAVQAIKSGRPTNAVTDTHAAERLLEGIGFKPL